VAKYAQASVVRVRIAASDTRVEVEIADRVEALGGCSK
jgi:signal transduction histidine kinase